MLNVSMSPVPCTVALNTASAAVVTVTGAVGAVVGAVLKMNMVFANVATILANVETYHAANRAVMVAAVDAPQSVVPPVALEAVLYSAATAHVVVVEKGAGMVATDII